MKQIYTLNCRALRFFATALLLLAVSVEAKAYDFEAINDDGVAIYYNISGSEAIVTYKTTNGLERKTSTDYSGSVVIPEKVTYNGTTYTVTQIGRYTFQNCTHLTSVSIPESVTTIGEHAFSGCLDMGSISIPNSVTTLGDEVFAYCFYTSNIFLGNSVTSIGFRAFYECERLGSITFPNSVTEIGDDAFYLCKNLKSVTIGNGVTTIGSKAFEACSGLSNITISESVTSIGDRAFESCSGLTRVNFNATACKDAGFSSSTYYGVFYRCTNISTVNIGDNVTIIPEYLFQNLSKLTQVTIPNNVTSIGSHAFDGCAGMTQITIGNRVTEIGDSAFCNCSGLESISSVNLEPPTCGMRVFSNVPTRTCVLYVPERSEEAYATKDTWQDFSDIREKFFSDNQYFVDGIYYKHYITGATVTSKFTGDEYPYYSEYVEIPDIVTLNGQRCEVIEIEDEAFYNCTKVTSITIPESVTSIGDRAFQDCTGLTEVAIPNGVTIMGDYAFYGCTGLTSVSIGNGVTSIGDYAFYGCTEVTSVGIGNGVTSIGDSAFYNCRTMRELTIGSRVATIGNSAFDSCRRLESLTSLNTAPPTCSAAGNGVFYNVPVKTCTLYVTEGSLAAYASAYAWEDFLTIIDNQVDAIEDIVTNGSAEAVGYYTLDGKQVPSLQRGINIVRYSDGTAKKILMK